MIVSTLSMVSVRGFTTPRPSSLSPNDIMSPGPRGSVFEHELIDIQPFEVRHQRPVTAAQQVSIHPGSSCRGRHARRVADSSKPSTTRLIRVTANSSSSAGSFRAASAAHMNVRVWSWREDQLGEHRLVELDEVRPVRDQLGELFAKDRDDVLGEILLRRVDRAGHLRDVHRPGEKVGPRKRDLDGPIRVRLANRKSSTASGSRRAIGPRKWDC